MDHCVPSAFQEKNVEIFKQIKICDESLKLVQYWIVEVEYREMDEIQDGRRSKEQLKEICSNKEAEREIKDLQ